ncbi:MAG: hypothetical protein V3V11_03925, partial [Vicinamibacteria bacterium]
LLLLAVAVAADVVIFTDGTRMRVQKYEIKNKVVVITTMDGKLRSIPSNYINLDATERLNGRQRPQQSQKAQQATPAPPPGREPSARPTPAEAPPAAEPAPALPEPPPAPRRTIPKILASDIPPPVWTNDELGVSLVVPSMAWQVQDVVASFDVAVQLEKKEGEARATLALIRRSMRSYKDFRKVIGEVESSVAAAPGFRFLGSGPLDLGPYTAYELRFIKQVADLPVYNRIVAYYSKDLAYLLSLACPETRLAENQDDFDWLARGLVIKKARGELTPKGKPKN